jgi:hypothetical protein
MSFQAKRLRVQLPCEGDSVEVAGEFGDEPIINGVCIDAASFVYASCADEFTWYLLMVQGAPAVLDAEQLPMLRRRLEDRLKEVDAAEQALKDTGPPE